MRESCSDRKPILRDKKLMTGLFRARREGDNKAHVLDVEDEVVTVEHLDQLFYALFGFVQAHRALYWRDLF
jgi:hypothetical protein